MKREKFFLFTKQYLLFSAGGIGVFGYEILVTVLLTELFHLWHMYSYAISLITGITLLFFYHSYITFKKTKHLPTKIFRYIITYSLTYLLSWILVLFTTQKIKIHYLLSIGMIAILLSFITYHINKKWTFRT